MSELTKGMATRARGAEAFERLRQEMREYEIEVALDHAELLSTSFLDELVRQIQEQGLNERVTFLVSDTAIIDKLERISAIRKATVYARSSADALRRPVTPREVHFTTTFSPTKLPV